MWYKVGDIITVNSWWSKPKSHIRCEIIEIHDSINWIIVKPLEGDPHWRIITDQKAQIISKE